MSRRIVAASLGAGGLLLAVGGSMHPKGEGDEVDNYLASMLGAPSWEISHVLLLAGTLLAVAGFVVAGRTSLFGSAVNRVLAVAVVGWSFAALELLPHVFAVRDLDELHHHADTPMLDFHLMLQPVATPALGLTAVALAVAVARAAGTKPAWALSVLAIIGGLGYAAAGPLVNITDDMAFTPLFAAQAGVAVWLIGTAVRVAAGNGRGGRGSGSPVSASMTGPGTRARSMSGVARSEFAGKALRTIVDALSTAGMMAAPETWIYRDEVARRA